MINSIIGALFSFTFVKISTTECFSIALGKEYIKSISLVYKKELTL